MGTKTKIALAISPFVILVGLLVVLAQGHTFAILETQGPIAAQEKRLLAFAFGLSLFVIVPVYVLTVFIAWKYRAGNKKAHYNPNWGHSRQLETIWWGIPCFIILVLSVITWRSSHSLDPARAISSSQPTLQVQVVALQWKWLFIYPQQGIATVDELHIPAGRPVQFSITSDAPMNSFWIPQLGGQMYAMSGMTTTLHLQADKTGTYQGVSANISGEGFADMRFTTTASSEDDFSTWVQQTRQSATRLNNSSYRTLAEPSSDNVAMSFASVEHNLYDTIVTKYMSDETTETSAHGH